MCLRSCGAFPAYPESLHVCIKSGDPALLDVLREMDKHDSLQTHMHTLHAWSAHTELSPSQCSGCVSEAVIGNLNVLENSVASESCVWRWECRRKERHAISWSNFSAFFKHFLWSFNAFKHRTRGERETGNYELLTVPQLRHNFCFVFADENVVGGEIFLVSILTNGEWAVVLI